MSSSLSTIYNQLTYYVSLYIPIFLLCIGTIGSFCNFITFTTPQLKNNSCSLYLLWGSIFDLITINFGQWTRLLADHASMNPQNQIYSYCKFRAFILNAMPALATAFIVVASIDRFVSTSERLTLRSMATTKIAHRTVPMVILIVLLFSIHYPLFFEIRTTCAARPGIYTVFIAVYSIVGTSILPQTLMLIFGLGTYWHFIQSRRRIRPIIINNQVQQQLRRKERNDGFLIAMMLVQVGISTLLMLTRTGFYAYSVLSTGNKSTDQRALDTLLNQFTAQLFYLNYAKSFYIYTLSSRYFRHAFLQRLQRFFRRLR